MSASTKSLGELEAELEAIRLEKASHEEELRMEPALVSNRPSRWRFLRHRVEVLKTQADKLEKAKREAKDYVAWDRKTRAPQ